MLYKTDKSTWLSKDTSNHGGAAFKQWIEKGRGLRFSGSLVENMNPIWKKHESFSGSFIPFSDLKFC